MTETDPYQITSLDGLEDLYGEINPTSLAKELDHLNAPYRAYIKAAPLVMLATVGPEGLDCSPRGDPAGFVDILDERTLALPDRRGNNRIDSLRNIVRDPRISLLFLIPGVGNTLRINGTAKISTDPALTGHYQMNGKTPLSVLVITIETVYFQCRKALARSDFWNPDKQVDPASLPSAGEMIRAAMDGDFDSEDYDRAYPARMKETLY